MPQYSDKRLSFLKSCLRKIQSNCVKARSVRFETPYDVNKIDFYCNTEDQQTALCNSFVVYYFSCADCDANYIDKTERMLNETTVEHAWADDNRANYKHLNDFTGVHFTGAHQAFQHIKSKPDQTLGNRFDSIINFTSVHRS